MAHDVSGTYSITEPEDSGSELFSGDIVLVHGIFSSAKTWRRLIRRAEMEPALRNANFRTFEYESPRWRLPLSASRIPDYNDIEESLRSFLRLEDDATAPLAIVAHSQGGLIVQRFLASAIDAGRAKELARIRFVMLLACPNEGSQYLSLPRRMLGFSRHPQARDLDPLSDAVHKSRQTVLASIIHAESVTSHSCPIPIRAYAGRTDNIVRATSAKGVFENPGTIPGNHSGILNPGYKGSLTVTELSSLARQYARTDHAPQVAEAAPAARYDTNSLPRDIPDFAGRRSETKQLVELLTAPASGARPLVNVFGKPGAGKSALAVHAAWLVGQHFPDGRLHVDLRGQNGEPQDSDELISRLRAEFDDGGVREIEKLSTERQLQELARDKRLLIVLDNAIDAGQVRVAALATPTCGVLVTSRSPLAGLEGVHSVHIGAVSPSDGLRLLQSVANRPYDASEAMTEIVRLCGGLPLALRIAGALLKSRPHTPSRFLEDRLRNERQRIERLQSGDLDVASSFTLSLTELSALDIVTLRRMARANVSSYDAALVGRLVGCSAFEADDRLVRLVTAQLIDEDETGRFTLHDLIRLFAADLPAGASDSDGEEARAILSAVSTTLVEAYLGALRAGSGPFLAILGGRGSHVYIEPSIRWCDASERTHDARTSLMELSGSANAIVLSGPGTGKTAAALHYVQGLAGSRDQSEHSARVPFYLALREWRAGSLVKAVAATARAHVGVEMTSDVVNSLLGSGDGCIVADGLDAIVDLDRRVAVVSALNELAAEFPRAQIVVFSRPSGYETCPMDPALFAKATLEPWTSFQIDQFITQKVSAAGGSSEQSAALRVEIESGAEEDRRSPLALSMIVENYLSTGGGIHSIAEITEAFVAEALERDMARWGNGTPDRTMTLLRRVLGRLAVDSLKPESEGSYDVPVIRATAIDVAAAAGVQDPSEFARFVLTWTRERSTLLVAASAETYRFSVAWTRDLLAGQYLVETSTTVEDLAAALLESDLRAPGSRVLEFAVRAHETPLGVGTSLLARYPHEGLPQLDPDRLLGILACAGVSPQDVDTLRESP